MYSFHQDFESYEELVGFVREHRLDPSVVEEKVETPKPARGCKPWTSSEDRFVTDNYSAMSGREIGERLGRSTAAIHARSKTLRSITSRLNRSIDTTRQNGAQVYSNLRTSL